MLVCDSPKQQIARLFMRLHTPHWETQANDGVQLSSLALSQRGAWTNCTAVSRLLAIVIREWGPSYQCGKDHGTFARPVLLRLGPDPRQSLTVPGSILPLDFMWHSPPSLGVTFLWSLPGFAVREFWSQSYQPHCSTHGQSGPGSGYCITPTWHTKYIQWPLLLLQSLARSSVTSLPSSALKGAARHTMFLRCINFPQMQSEEKWKSRVPEFSL